MKRSLCSLLVLVMFGLLGASVFGQPVTNPDTFVKVAIHTIESLDPQFHTGSTSAEITGNVYDPLFDHVKGNIESVGPALATVVPTEENGLITRAEDGTTFIVCPIREGVKFHNGAVLTPEDVEYTFERAALVGGIYTTLAMIYKPLLGTGVFSDLVEDSTVEAPYAQAAAKILQETVLQALHTLSEREREILTLHFGLNGNEPLTFEQIAVQFNLSSERVRQIQVAALKKLRHPTRRKFFDGYA